MFRFHTCFKSNGFWADKLEDEIEFGKQNLHHIGFFCTKIRKWSLLDGMQILFKHLCIRTKESTVHLMKKYQPFAHKQYSLLNFCAYYLTEMSDSTSFVR